MAQAREVDKKMTKTPEKQNLDPDFGRSLISNPRSPSSRDLPSPDSHFQNDKETPGPIPTSTRPPFPPQPLRPSLLRVDAVGLDVALSPCSGDRRPSWESEVGEPTPKTTTLNGLSSTCPDFRTEGQGLALWRLSSGNLTGRPDRLRRQL